MKKLWLLPLFALLAMTITALPATAASFGSSVDVSTDSDVLNLGNTALAFDVTDYLGNTGPTEVNGVYFSGSLGTLTSVDLSLGNFPNADDNGVANTYDGSPALGTMSSDYIHILDDNLYNANSPNPSTITLSNLKPYESYELQLFDGTNGTGPGTEGVSDGLASGTLDYNNAPSYASYIIETFTTSANTSEVIDITDGPAQGGSTFGILDALNLQEVPEPSTYALILGGLAFLGICVRRKISRIRA